MNHLQSSDLKDISFHWTANGVGAIPLHTATFKARLISNHFPCDEVEEIGPENFKIEDADQGMFRMELSDEKVQRAFQESDSLTLIVYGAIQGSGVTPVCKRVVLK